MDTEIVVVRVDWSPSFLRVQVKQNLGLVFLSGMQVVPQNMALDISH